ncbi:TetR/AcrR family transcriptional regulator [Paenarthrobacter sp. NPDC092416]|uniref:TetR/AcrR family transcriptional regulator n=1 Tax=Paenarthrobacter sp. NPDC092416 TaxID=3364386 RepID=UPI0037FC6289
MTPSQLAATTPTKTRNRRFDPERRDRLIDTALNVIAAKGVAGATHREIAREADVPLGSMTYHFANMDELLYLAFSRFVETCAARFDVRMQQSQTPEQAQEAVVQGIVKDYLGTSEEMILAYELYAVAARKPLLREIMQQWMEASQHSLQRHFTADDARIIDAFIEGLIVHGSLAVEPMTEGEVRAAVHRLTDPLLLQRKQ